MSRATGCALASWLEVVAAIAVVGVGCGGDGSDTPVDGGRDAGSDGGDSMDGAPDAETDAAVPLPMLISAHFPLEGLLRLEFDRPVPDPGALTVSITPDRPGGIGPDTLIDAGEGLVDVELSTYHFPIDYTVTVTYAGGVPQEIVVDGNGNGGRVAFVTETTGTGDLDAWTPETDEGPLPAADAICQQEAASAGFEGTFRAMLGIDGEVDPLCRLYGHDGLLSTNCGQAEPPSDTGIVLDARGLPILFGYDAIRDAEWRLPIRYHADGTLVAPRTFAWTGAGDDGTAYGIDCDGWQSGSLAMGKVWYSVESIALPVPDYLAGCAGGPERPLVCFQVDEAPAQRRSMHVRDGKRVFVTSTTVDGAPVVPRDPEPDLIGVEAADALCWMAAGSPDGVQYAAFLSTSTDDAYCRVLGLSGQKAADCGQATLPTGGGPWVRADGYLVAENVTDLTDGTLAAPILLDENGAFLPDAPTRAWTASDVTGERWTFAGTCSDWESTSNDAATGLTEAAAGASWTRYDSRSCRSAWHLYCFEL